jgi:hypothetical protein
LPKLPISRPWSRTGENPPYGILGGTMETSASFEARSAPSSYPTATQSSRSDIFCGVCRKSAQTGCRASLLPVHRSRQ